MTDGRRIDRTREELARRDAGSPETADPERPERPKIEEQERAVRDEHRRGGAD